MARGAVRVPGAESSGDRRSGVFAAGRSGSRDLFSVGECAVRTREHHPDLLFPILGTNGTPELGAKRPSFGPQLDPEN